MNHPLLINLTRSPVLLNTKSLLMVTAALELGAGMLLLISPSLTSQLLLGAGLVSPESILVGRLGGAALLSIGRVCWLEGSRDPSGSVNGLVGGLLFYNAAVVLLVGYAGLVDKMNGVGIWPACGVHSAMFIWCAVSLRASGLKSAGSKRKTQPTK